MAGYTDAQLLGGADPHTTFAVFELLDHGKSISRNLVFFEPAKRLKLPVPHVRAQLQPGAHGYTLSLTTDNLAREVWVSFANLDFEVSDNAFTILPGQSVTVKVQSKASLDVLRKALRVQDLVDAMHGGGS